MAEELSIYTPRVLIGAVRLITPPRTFLRDKFVKRIIEFDTESIDFDLVKGNRKMAPFVSPMHEGKIMQRQGYETKTIKPAYVKPKRAITPNNAMSRRPGEAYNSGVTPQQRAVQILGTDLAFLDESIVRREEWMVAQALFTGGISVKGEGVDFYVDFDINTIIPPAAEAWNAPGVTGKDMLRHLREWRAQPTKDGSAAPDIAIMSSDVAEVVIDTLIDFLDTRSLDLGTLEIRDLPNGVTFIGRIKGTGIDLYSYEEWYVDDESGETMPMVPKNTMLLASSSVDAAMLYGAIMDIDVLHAMARYPKTWKEEDPSRRFLMLQAAPMFSPFDTGAFQIVHPLV